MQLGEYRRVTTVADDAGVNVGYRSTDPDDHSFYAKDDGPGDVERGQWAIWLPHDCDDWVIAVGEPHEVIAEAKRFIAAVEEAVAHIEAQTPF